MKRRLAVFAILLLATVVAAACANDSNRDAAANGTRADADNGEPDTVGEAVGNAIDDTVDALRGAETVVVPAGTVIQTELRDRLDSGESQRGDAFTLRVVNPVLIGDDVVVPAGSLISGTVTAVESAGRPQKGGRIDLRADQLDVNGEAVPIDATIRFEGEGSVEEDLKEIGILGAVGAAVGGILDGAKGAVIGGIVGAGGTFLATKGEQVELGPGTRMVVELDGDASVTMGH